MTAKIDALRALKAAVDLGDRHKLNIIVGHIGYPSDVWPWDWMSRIDAAFSGSLDAAKALHEAVLPGCWMRMSGPWPEDVGGAGIWTAKIYRKTGPGYVGKAATAARAWLLAILAALIAQEEAR